MTTTAQQLLDKYGVTMTLKETAIVLKNNPKSYLNTLSSIGAEGLDFPVKKIAGRWRVSSIALGNLVDGIQVEAPPTQARKNASKQRKPMLAFIADLKNEIQKLEAFEQEEVLSNFIPEGKIKDAVDPWGV